MLKRIKTVLVKKINRVLANFLGVEVKTVKSSPKHIIETNHPIEAQYLDNALPFLMNLPLCRGRVWRWYSLSKNSSCPFIVAAREYLKNNSVEVIENVLGEYESTIQPHYANEALGFSKNFKVFPKGNPPQKVTLPWINKSVNEFYDSWKRSTIEENSLFGLNSLEFIGSGYASKDKIKIEATRLEILLESIQNNGYQLNTDDCIGAVILIDKNEWRWYVSGGQHRASILAAMEYKTVPVLIKKVVRRQDVNFWPNVVSGVYTKEAALDFFDRRFNAVTPFIYKKG